MILFLVFPLYYCCMHDQMEHNFKLLELNDTDEYYARRLLQDSRVTTTTGRYSIFYPA